MQKFLCLLFCLGFATTSALAQSGRIGEVRVDVDKNTIPVRVSGNTPELNGLAQQAFNAHGRYKVVASGHQYDIRFTAGTGNTVRVDVTRGSAGTPVISETASGSSVRNALLKAADIAVAQTNGMGLSGFFTGRLAFVSERSGKKEIYVSDLFFGEAKQVTTDRALVMTPRWSPDGTKILYTSFKSAFADIYQYDLRTYERTTFVSFKGTNQGARFSPNGQQVAMVLSGEGNTEIYVSNAQGKQVARRTRSEAVKSSPTWSPDGSQLVFEMEPGPQLYVMSAAGGAARRLSSSYSFMAEADWSRKSNKIVCTVRIPGGKFRIAVLDPNTGKAEIVDMKNPPFDAVEASWLADGRHVVYTARDSRTSVLCILDTETGKSTPISTSFGTAMGANVWTP